MIENIEVSQNSPGVSVFLKKLQILMNDGIVATSFIFSKTSIHFCWKRLICPTVQVCKTGNLSKSLVYFKKFEKTLFEALIQILR